MVNSSHLTGGGGRNRDSHLRGGAKNLFEIYLKCSRGAQNAQGGGGGANAPPTPLKKNLHTKKSLNLIKLLFR